MSFPQPAALPLQLATYFLPYIRLPNTLVDYKITLKMETAMFADTSDNSQYSTHVTPKAEVAN
jgi:hypothetical protein